MDFATLGNGIDIVEIWFGIANGQILTIFDRVSCPRHMLFSFQGSNLSQSQWIFTKPHICIDIVEIWFEIAIGYISSIFDRVISPW